MQRTITLSRVCLALISTATVSVGNPIIELPDDFELHGIAISRGFEPIEIRLDNESSASDTRQATVIVNRQDTPIVLVLAADEPTVWKVGRTEGTDIAGVIVSGDHGQGSPVHRIGLY